MKVDLGLPILPTTTVGSFPQTPVMRAFRSKVRRDKISAEDQFAQECQWIEENILWQESMGIDVLVDGEPYRGDMVAFFAEAWPGFVEGGFVRSYGNRYYRKPVIIGELDWKPATVKHWQFADSERLSPLSNVKGMVTGAYTIMDWSFNEYYGSRRDVVMALAKVLNQECRALREVGARIIQIDEPAISVRPDELKLAIEAMEVMTDGIEGVYFISHICYGAFDKVYPALLDLPVDQLDLEIACSAFDLFDMFAKYPYTKDIGLGVFDIHSHQVPTVKEIEDRIKFALQYLKPEQIWVDPDCGLKTRTMEESDQSLRNMVEATFNVRKEIGAV